jgi:hypothetical protein
MSGRPACCAAEGEGREKRDWGTEIDMHDAEQVEKGA